MKHSAVRGLLVGTLYAVFLLVPSELKVEGHEVSFFWPGSGIALALAMNFGAWPLLSVFVVDGLALNRLGIPLGASLVGALGLVGQAYLGAWFFRGPLRGNPLLNSREDLSKFLLAAVIAAPVIAATLGAAAWADVGEVPWSRIHSTWLSWWFGESVGILFVGPMLLGGISPLLRGFRRRPSEMIVVTLCFVLVCSAVFYADPDIPPAFRAPLAFLPIPLLFWSASRLGIPHASLLMLCMGVILSMGARAGFGPLGRVDSATDLIIVWTYAYIAGLTTLFIGAIQRERDTAVNALRMTEARFQNLVECGPSMVYVVNHDNLVKMRYVSPQSVEILGYTPEECLRDSGVLVRNVHPEDAQAMLEAVRDAWQRLEPMVLEYRIFHRDGSIRWVRDEARYLPARSGAPAQWQGILIDVTSHREIAEKHRKSEALLSGIWSTSFQGLFVLDTEGRVLMANPAASRIMGIGREELAGMAHDAPQWRCETVDGQELAQEDLPFSLVMRTQAPLEKYVLAIVNARGERRILSTEGAPLRDAAGRLTGAYFVVEDITSAHEAEMRLQSSEARLATIFGSANDAIITLDEARCITLFNPSAARTFGYLREQVLGRPLTLLLPEAAAILVGCDGETAAMPEQRNATGKRANGEHFPAEVSVSCAKMGGHCLYTVFLRDMSERARAEEQRLSLEAQLRQAQKIEAVGQLAGGVAHDFNNLLQVMQGFTYLAIEEADDAEVRRTHLENVCSAVEKAASLTAQLLAFGRRQSLEKTDCNLNVLVQDHLKMVRRLIGEHIVVEFAPGDAVGNVRVDRSQIEQVLLNLCLNARDAMPDGGTLVLGLENVVIDAVYVREHSWARAGAYVRLTVTDTGTGMDEAVQGKIYEPFFTTKPQGQGTGLGLSVVHGIVEQHGGLIHVSSALGQGSSFGIYLPIVERKADTMRLAAPMPALAGKGTVLLAEDEPAVREIAIRQLQRAGFTVIAAENGAVAVELFRQHADEIALVVLDVVMPQMGGFEAYAAIRAIREGVPAIFSSGYSGNALSAGGELPQGGHFLNKPYRFEQLLSKISEVMGPTAASG